MRKQLLVEAIRLDGETQSRDRINSETVAEYAETLQAPSGFAPGGATPRHGGGWPPIEVYFDGTEYWMADGFHRLLAAQRVGRKNIEADVKQGTREDAAWASCAANQTHGLRRTNADKRKAVEMALRLHPEKSDSAVAHHCGVSREFVLRLRHETQPQPVIGSQVEKRVGLDGRARSMPPEKPEGVARQPIGPPPDSGERDCSRAGGRGMSSANAGCASGRQLAGGEGGASGSHAPPGGAVKSVGVFDEVGREIPEHLIDLWNRRQEVQDMLTAISRVRVKLGAAQESRDPLLSEVPFSSALAHLDQAYSAVQVAKPYAVCAFCQGHGCKACGQRGLLGKFRWDMTVPKEHKEAVGRMVGEKAERLKG